MSIKYVLFDLDGTLLPMDQDEFIKNYFTRLAAYMAPYGYEPSALISAVWKGTKAMEANNGVLTNEEVFWNAFTSERGDRERTDIAVFDGFYLEEFQKSKEVCSPCALAEEIVDFLKSKGVDRVLATNPVFPALATLSRIRWAGLEAEDFILYTTFENSHYCKPDLNYYKEILEKIGAKPEECLMVGNDTGDDMVASELGMKVYLVTDNLINRNGLDIELYPHGSLKDFKKYVQELFH